MSHEPKARLKLKEFEDRARAARDSWISESLKGARLEEKVKKQLNEGLQSMIWFILGLEKDWHDGWRISRTNGREPAIYQEIQDRVRKAAAAVVDDALSTKPTLNKTQRDAIRKAYIEQLAWKARDIASNEAARDANDILDRVLDEVGENDMPFCPVCQVRHLEPLHETEAQSA